MEFAQAWPVPDADIRDGQAGKPRVQALFRRNIESAGCLVENCKARSTEQEPREGQTLLLAPRQQVGPVELGIETAEPAGEIGKVDFAQHFRESFVADRVGPWILNLLANRTQDQIRLLWHEQDLIRR